MISGADRAPVAGRSGEVGFILRGEKDDRELELEAAEDPIAGDGVLIGEAEIRLEVVVRTCLCWSTVRRYRADRPGRCDSCGVA